MSTYHLQLTDSGKSSLHVPDFVDCFFASSNLLIEEGLVSAQSLICHVQDNTFGEFELLWDLVESKMRPFSLQMLVLFADMLLWFYSTMQYCTCILVLISAPLLFSTINGDCIHSKPGSDRSQFNRLNFIMVWDVNMQPIVHNC